MLAAGCLLGPTAPAAPAAVAEEPVTLTVGMMDSADSLNPFTGIEQTSLEMWQLMYDRLVSFSATDLSPEPALATSWESSADGLTWTFHLTDRAQWSDGEPLTADDVTATYARILDGGPEAATWGSYLAQVTEVTAPDPTTVVLKLTKPNSSLPMLPIPIVPEHVWRDIDEQEVTGWTNAPEDGEPPVGSGPFRLVEGTSGGSTFVFEANPDYWQGAAHVDRLVFRVFRAQDPMAQALRTGEIDVAEGLTALQVEALDGQDGITAHDGETPGFLQIGFNVGAVDLETGDPIGDGHPALRDPAFRQALGYAVDRDLLVDKVFQGAGAVGTSIIPPTYPGWHWEPPAGEAFTYDPDRAAELLDRAGYEIGDDGRRTMPDGSRFGTLRLVGRSEAPGSIDTMEYFQEWLADLGIDAEVTTMESSELTSAMVEGTYDVFEWGWVVDPDPTTMLSYLTCGQRGLWSDTWYCEDDYDRLYEQQLVETDHETRVEMVHEMQRIVYEDAPYLLTAYSTVGEAYRSDRFAGVVPQPEPDGVWLLQYGPHTYLDVRPAAEAEECDEAVSAPSGGGSAAGDDPSTGTAVAIGVGVAAVAALVLALGVGLRRRATVGERE